MERGTWEPGDVVVWREAWRGQTYIGVPVRVVEDGECGLAFYVSEGTRFAFPPGGWPFADEHPWAANPVWTGHGLLALHRPGDAFTTWHVWEGAERRFVGWYVNFQEPLRRTERGFDTQDQELDLVVEPDGSWRWKDERELEDWVPRGRFTREEVAAIRAEGERVVAEWPFPTGLEEWEPHPAWPVPTLPDDWRTA
jgi:Protein of unknown function (DUF402)